jgi:hypothetical protein
LPGAAALTVSVPVDYYGVPMSVPARCFVIVPSTMVELHAQLVAAFVDDPQVFVLRDRRTDDRSLRSVGVFAVGGGELDPALRTAIEDKLRRLGVRQ